MSAAAIGAAQEGYIDAALASKSQRYVGRVLPVRYEDLVRQPAEVLAAVETFLGLSPQAMEVDTSGVDFEAEHQTSRPLHSPLYGKRPTSERVGVHVHVLSPADIDAVRAATPMMRRRFGYA